MRHLTQTAFDTLSIHGKRLSLAIQNIFRSTSLLNCIWNAESNIIVFQHPAELETCRKKYILYCQKRYRDGLLGSLIIAQRFNICRN